MKTALYFILLFLLFPLITLGQTSLLSDDGASIFTVSPFSNNFGIGLTAPEKTLHLYKNGNQQSDPPTIRLEYCLAEGTQGGGGGGGGSENDGECPSPTVVWDIFNQHSLNFSNPSEGTVFYMNTKGSTTIPKGYLRVGESPGAVASGENRLLVTEGRIMVGKEGISGQLYSHLEPNDLKFNRDGAPSYITQMGTGNLSFITNGDYTKIRMALYPHGDLYIRNNVGIGTTSPAYKLDVCGTIRAGQVKVENTTGWCDYVFAEDYELRSLQELEAFINTNKHLPEVPSEYEVLENGVDLGEMDKILLKKVEELTLYVIELEKKIRALEAGHND